MDVLLAFVLAGLALAGSPGPNTLSLAATGAAFGVRRGLVYLIGLTAGMVAVMGIAATGMIGLLMTVPGAAPAVTIIVATYFLYLAFRIATASPLSDDSGQRRQPSLAAGLFLSLVNPKGYAAMAAMYSGFTLKPDDLWLDAAAKTIVLTTIIVAVNLAWLVAGAALTRLFRDPRTNRIVNVAFAVLLLLSVAFALML
jgi:threonine/homoserine/homoserine lactone efflux protein